MSQHDPFLSLLHMRDHAREAVEMLGDKSVDDLVRDRTLQLALVRLIEIVGEASTRVGPEVRRQLPDVPWREAAAMRNKVIHEYDYVDLNVVHDTIHNDLPPLIARLEAFLSQA